MDLDDRIARWARGARAAVEAEKAAEVEEALRLRATRSARELEARGLTVLGLKVVEEATGFGGRTVLVLAPTAAEDLPPGGPGPGAIVTLRAGRGAPGSSAPAAASGVIARREARRLVVALHDEPEGELAPPLRLDRVADDVTYRRLDAVLRQLPTYRGGPADRLRSVLFGQRAPEIGSPIDWTPFSDELDDTQRDAVDLASRAREISLLHGPPGTGKTTALVELIRQSVRRRERVLVCAPSNVAVDNLVERLVAAEVSTVRVGHPARLLASVVDHSLDALVERDDGRRIVASLRRDMEKIRRRRRRAGDRATRRELGGQLRELAREARALEGRIVENVIRSSAVVAATCTGAADGVLAGVDFDRAVIDEAAQAIEPACWIPLLKAKRATLAGDHLQLPPTVRSREALRGGLAITLFERLARELGEPVTRRLAVQYRMHQRIMEWSSRELYEGTLEAHASVKNHRLADLPGCRESPETTEPLLVIDTAGCGFEETPEPQGSSRLNEGEVDIVAHRVGQLVESGVAPADLAVIAPYNAQVRLLRERLRPAWPDLEIGSVDGLQGREKEAVVISTVRSNPRGEVGFLADERRMNVAVTRARRHVTLVGDSATMARNGFLDRLFAYFQQEGEYRSGWEYV